MNPAAANPAVSSDSPSPRSSPPAPQARTSSMRPAPDPRSPKPITTPNPRHPDHPHDTTTTHSPARPDRAGLIHTQTSLNGNDATMCKISDAQQAGRGGDLLGPVAYLDVDGTIAPTYGEHKAGMDMSYKGIWGYAPLIVSLANTKEVLYLVNRSGNAPSHAGAAPWIDKAIELVTSHAARVCLRGDTDFSLTAHFDRWAERVDFVFGMDCNTALRSRAEALAQTDWTPLQRPAAAPARSGQRRRREPNHKRRIIAERGYVNLELNGEHVAEFSYQPGKCARPYRVIALRKNISKTHGEQALLDEIRYFFYITTRTDLTPAQVVACANDRCDQENVIEQLKNGVNALRVPLYDLVSNWAYMVIAALAWNMKSWWAMMLHHKADRREYIAMEFRRFINSVIIIPAMIVRRARTITVRIIGYHPSLDRFFSAYNTIERTRFD